MEVGLEQPLVSLDEAGRPVLAPAAVADIARVSPELADRVEATKRDALAGGAGAGGPAARPTEAAMDPPPGARASGRLGQTERQGIPGDAAAGGSASPTLDLAKGRKVLLRQGDREIPGEVLSPVAGGGVLVQTGDGPVLVSTGDLTGMGAGTKAGPAPTPRAGTRGRGTKKGPPLSRPGAGQVGAGVHSPRKGDKVAFRIHGREMSGTVIRSAKNGMLKVRAGDTTVIVRKRDVIPSPRLSRGRKGYSAPFLRAVDIPGNDPKPLSDWLADHPELLEEARRLFTTEPQWQGIDPDNSLVFYRPQDEVKEIRAMKGEGPGHHPHGLALGGPSGQQLTHTGDKLGQPTSPRHVEANNFQAELRKAIKRELGM